MLSDAERSALAVHGFLRRQVFTAAEAATMQDAIWAAVSRGHAIDRADAATWRVEHPSRLNHIPEAPTFLPIGGDAMRGAIDDCLGAGTWDVPRRWGAFHVSFPVPGREWTVPHTLWHADFPFELAPAPLPGVKVFVFVSDVPTHGGGTLVVVGSHRLIRRIAADAPLALRADTRAMRLRILGSDPWLRALTSPADRRERVRRFSDEAATIDGVELRVVELTGRAGEIVLTDPWLLHCRAPNGGVAPRFMRSTDIYRRELHPWGRRVPWRDER